jgi:hypothetical protein
MRSDQQNENSQDPALNVTGAEAGELKSTDSSAPSSLECRSTGPRTQSGKDRSKQNSFKHGIFSKEVVLKSESQADFCVLLITLNDYFLLGLSVRCP